MDKAPRKTQVFCGIITPNDQGAFMLFKNNVTIGIEWRFGSSRRMAIYELLSGVDVLSLPNLSRRMYLKITSKIVARIDTTPAEKNAGL